MISSTPVTFLLKIIWIWIYNFCYQQRLWSWFFGNPCYDLYFFYYNSQALKILRTAEFKPYVIFVKPRVPEIRRQPSSPTSPGRGGNGHITVSLIYINPNVASKYQSFSSYVLHSWQKSLSLSHCEKDEDLQDMRQSAEQMDQQYGHLVDRVLVKEDSACAELRNILERLEREPQWVPVSWVRSWSSLLP